MIEVIYATTNRPKVRSLQRRLKPHGFRVVQASLQIPEPRFNAIEDLAVFKALFARQEFGGPVVTNDAGFFIERLNGFPGSNVKFGLQTIGLDGLIRLGKGSDCWFRHAIAYHDGRADCPVVFGNTIRGRIASERRGEKQDWHWSELSLIFIPKDSKKTLGEMTEDEWVAHQTDERFGAHYADQFVAWHRHNRT